MAPGVPPKAPWTAPEWHFVKTQQRLTYYKCQHPQTAHRCRSRHLSVIVLLGPIRRDYLESISLLKVLSRNSNHCYLTRHIRLVWTGFIITWSSSAGVGVFFFFAANTLQACSRAADAFKVTGVRRAQHLLRGSKRVLPSYKLTAGRKRGLLLAEEGVWRIQALFFIFTKAACGGHVFHGTHRRG